MSGNLFGFVAVGKKVDQFLLGGRERLRRAQRCLKCSLRTACSAALSALSEMGLL